MKYFKIILIFLIFVGVNGCGNFRDAVTGQTKKTTDEFLIKKKDPLILPPDYDTLPIPKTMFPSQKIACAPHARPRLPKQSKIQTLVTPIR